MLPVPIVKVILPLPPMQPEIVEANVPVLMETLPLMELLANRLGTPTVPVLLVGSIPAAPKFRVPLLRTIVFVDVLPKELLAVKLTVPLTIVEPTKVLLVPERTSVPALTFRPPLVTI